MLTATPRSMAVLTSVAAGLLAAATLAMLFGGSLPVRLIGKGATPQLVAPDEVSAAAYVDPMPFLISRDKITIRVDTSMSVREFLDLHRLNRPNLRRQVLAQLGNPPMTAKVAPGTKLELQLTPLAEDIPATMPAKGPR
jgi:hypothetical protein